MGEQVEAAQDRDDEGFLVLRGELFWKWKALHESIARCDAEIKARSPLIDQMLDQLPELKQLLGERTSFVQQSHTARAEYQALLRQLEAHFGFPMKNVSIDDLTGRVHRLEEGAPEAPSVPSVKNGVNGHVVAPPVTKAKTKPKAVTKKRK